MKKASENATNLFYLIMLLKWLRNCKKSLIQLQSAQIFVGFVIYLRKCR
jgi:hypothetical protein